MKKEPPQPRNSLQWNGTGSAYPSQGTIPTLILMRKEWMRSSRTWLRSSFWTYMISSETKERSPLWQANLEMCWTSKRLTPTWRDQPAQWWRSRLKTLPSWWDTSRFLPWRRAPQPQIWFDRKSFTPAFRTSVGSAEDSGIKPGLATQSKTKRRKELFITTPSQARRTTGNQAHARHTQMRHAREHKTPHQQKHTIHKPWVGTKDTRKWRF